MDLSPFTVTEQNPFSTTQASSSSPLPTLSVSPAIHSNDLPPIEEPIDDSPIDSVEDGSTGSHQKTTWRTMFHRSSISSRSPNESKSSNLVTPDQCTISPSLEKQSASSSSSPLHQHYSSFSSSNENDKRFSSTRCSEANTLDALRSSGLLSSNRSPSPFTFRRGDSWVGASKLDYLQERHLKAPPATLWNSKPQSSSSSSSSDGTSPSDVKERRSVHSIFSSLSRSSRSDRFNGPYSNTEVNKAFASGDSVDKTSQRPTLSRPPLQRNRSQSRDVLQHFRFNARVEGLQDLAGLKGSDSVAAGTVSIVDVATLPERKQKIDPNLRLYNDRSRFSRLLTRKPSAIGQESSTCRIPTPVAPKVPEKEEMPSLRQIGPCEGALSRLTESIRGSKKSLYNVNNSKKMDSKQDSQQSKESVNHRRHCSTGSSNVFIISKPTVTRAKGDKVNLCEPSDSSPSSESGGGSSQLEGKNAKLSQRGIVAETDQASRVGGRAEAKDDAQGVSNAKSREGQVPFSFSSSLQYIERKRSMSFSKMMEPFLTSSKVESADVTTKTHTRDQSSEMEDDFFSATSMTPSNSDAAFEQYIMADKTAVRKATASKIPIAGDTPPLSFHGSPAEKKRQPSITKSESDPILVRKASNRALLPSFENRKQAPERLSSTQSSQRATHSIALNTKHRTESLAKVKSITSPAKGDVAVSDTKEDPLPLPRSSSRAAFNKSQINSSSQRKRALSKPSQSIDTKSFVASPSPPALPSSALGMSADLERVAQRSSTSTVGLESKHRRPSQASLSIKDDMEFLQALEYVRKINQVRIKKQDEEANRVEQMARLGMASVNRRAKGHNNRTRDAKGSSCAPLLRRSSSASAVGTKDSASLKSDTSASSFTREDINETPSALELGVGKASGKLRDGAFINDDDWKREVKALFVIREIVLTERSYARHLEALLQTVRALYPTQRRLNNSTASRSSNVGQVPDHIIVMRNLLPQLIALSRSLANRIDENPTAAGVGTAFRLVSSQMEATFIAWSSVIIDVMDALRSSEKIKSKSKDRIGLIHLHPLQHASSDDENEINGFVSVPCSPTSALKSKRNVMESKEMPSKSNESSITLPTSMIIEEINGQKSIPTVSRRRSTLSGLSPALAASLRAKISLSTVDDKLHKKADSTTSNSATSQSLGRRAMDAMVNSRPPLPSLTKSRSNAASLEFASNTDLMSKSTSSLNQIPSVAANNNTTPTKVQQSSSSTTESNPGKSLSALDVVIMPTQRIPRYLLLLRDLNVNTPPQSLSHIRLQRCLDFVARVASSCDKASRGTAK